jgi:sulfite dehydrogenase (cytochrome) subunit B
MKHRFLAASVLVLGLATAAGVSAAQKPVHIALPAQNAAFRPGPGIEAVQKNCLSCHSAEYVVSQPPLSKAVWTAEVTKMRAAYGASIPDADTEAIVNYLVAQNPVKK